MAQVVGDQHRQFGRIFFGSHDKGVRGRHLACEARHHRLTEGRFAAPCAKPQGRRSDIASGQSSAKQAAGPDSGSVFRIEARADGSAEECGVASRRMRFPAALPRVFLSWEEFL